jgi:plastocyanin
VAVPTRRAFITAGGLALAGLAAPRALGAAPARSGPAEGGPLEIVMMSDPLGTAVWFDPLGVYVEPGRTVRWIVHSNVHTTTAYHPRNDHHSLRIPERAEPWDSRFLVNPGNYFEVTLTVPGVYDYFCAPHEVAGMVGRIVVGRPAGPGALGFDYFRGRPGTETWALVPPAARKAFPSVSAIMRDRIVRRAAAPTGSRLG